MPVTIHMRAPYDGGMYFVGSLEKSETGTYKIGGFSIRPAAVVPPQGDSDDAGADGDETDGADGNAANAEATGIADEEEIYPIFEWTITAYLLYYG
jgi:hypothetical protein